MALLPDGSSHLTDGVVVETRLLARVLGLRLLRIDGTVLIAPGRLAAGTDSRSTARLPPGLAGPAGPAARLSEDAPPNAARRPVGDGLAEAARLLAESGASLRRTRG